MEGMRVRTQPWMRPPIKGDRNLLMTILDDSAIMKQIIAIRAPHSLEVDVRPLYQIAEDILNRSTPTVPSNTNHSPSDHSNDKIDHANVISVPDAFSNMIDRISCEIELKSLGRADGHATAVSLFNMLASYSWDAKLVLTLTAFALKYSEFWRLAQIDLSNRRDKSMAILITEHSVPLKPCFDALNNLISSTLDLTRTIISFKDLPSAYISFDMLEMTNPRATTIPSSVYWSLRSIIACATHITRFTSNNHEFTTSTMELAWESSTLDHKIKKSYRHLQSCYRHIDEKKDVEAYESLVHIFDMIHIDNMKVLRSLIYAKDDIQPLFDGSSKRRVNLDVLRRRNVLLIISGLEISQDELCILEQIYNEMRFRATRMESLYEVVWMPIVDHTVQWTNPMQKQFESLQVMMPWYSVHHPSLIDRVVVRFVKEKWHFRKKTIFVVLDPQGRVISLNAMHMMWIWGSIAFPFTSFREEALWREETWRLELLVDGIDPTIFTWIMDGKYIFLYGGVDIEWIRRFTAQAKAVAQAARIPLEMVYVGKSSKRGQVQRVINTITVEKLSYCWQDLALIWFFWTRLKNMLFSKIHLGQADDNGPMMQNIAKLLSYDKNRGWALLSKGSSVVVDGHSHTMFSALSEYDKWKEDVPVKGFDLSFADYHRMLQGVAYPCYRFELPTSAGRMPENIKCPECLRHMEKYTAFLCCHVDVDDTI